MPRCPFTPEEIRKAVQEAGSARAAARALGIDHSTVLKHAARVDAPEQPPAVMPPPEPLPPVPVPMPSGIEWNGAPPEPLAPAVERRIVIGDLHIPAHDARALSCVYALIRALQPSVVIQIGDLINSAAFSHHGPHSPQVERYDLSMMAGRGFIRSVKRAAPGARLIIVRGNHDDWASRYEAENPALEGSFDFEIQLGIRSPPDDDRPPPYGDVQVVRHAEENPLVLGPVAYAHGNGGGLHFAKRYAENNAPRTGVKIMRVGHHHTLQVYRHRNGHESWGVGWVGNEQHPAFHYAPAPRGWWVGVIVEDIVGDRVTTTPVPIVNGAALYAGRLILGDKQAVAA